MSWDSGQVGDRCGRKVFAENMTTKRGLHGGDDIGFFEQNLHEIVYDDEGLFGFWAEAGNICLGPKSASLPVLILLERLSRILRNIDSHSPRVELGEPEVKDFFFREMANFVGRIQF